jgi:putative hydrolase of the HAD superfamily
VDRVRLTGIRVIVFDLDDTLYPERAFALSGFRAVGQELQRRMNCPFDPAERMRKLFDDGRHGKIFDTVLDELGADASRDMIAELVQLYRTHPPTIELFADADAALRKWSGWFRLALISDGDERTQRNKIKALQVEGRLDPIVLTGEWGPDYWKPHPRAFEEVERLTGLAGAECVYLADNPAKDFVAPRRLGWVAVRVCRPGGVYADASPPTGGEPSYEITDLSQIELSY